MTTAHRQRTKPWYGTARWKRRRKECLEAAKYRCRLCLDRDQITVATVADHVERHAGDPDRFWNGELQALCAHCHNSVKQSEERGGKPKQAIGPDGWPVP